MFSISLYILQTLLKCFSMLRWQRHFSILICLFVLWKIIPLNIPNTKSRIMLPYEFFFWHFVNLLVNDFWYAHFPIPVIHQKSLLYFRLSLSHLYKDMCNGVKYITFITYSNLISHCKTHGSIGNRILSYYCYVFHRLYYNISNHTIYSKALNFRQNVWHNTWIIC